MRQATLVRLGIASSIAAVLVLGMVAGASAQITLGQTAPLGTEPAGCELDGYDEVQLSVTNGSSYTVPTAGVLTSWSTRAVDGGLLGLKVYRPVAGKYLVLAADGPRALIPGVVNTFSTAIPVLPGDLVGTSWPAGAKSTCAFLTGNPGDTLAYNGGNAPVGASIEMEIEDGFRLNVSATLLPPPTVTAISPASGSIVGQTVTIAGTNFAGVSAVSFGGVPAASYTVNSEGQITALAPRSKRPGSVAVTVTTPAGTATSPQAYSYLACTVPKLKDKKLKAAKRAIRKAGCKVGEVTKLNGATGKTGRVSRQKPNPGKVVITGTPVRITLKPQN